MKYQIDYRTFAGIFAVPTQLRPLLRTCSGTALKVLLCILSAPNEPITSSYLCAQLGFAPDDIEESLEYWVKNGLLSKSGDFPQESLEQLTVAPVSSPAAAPRKVRRITTKKTLTVPEIARLSQEDPNISALLSEAQNLLGRALSSPETETLCSFYSYDHLSPEYLLLVLAYCIERQKTSFRYLEKVVSTMLEKEIDTYEKAEAYLAREAEHRTNEGAVRAAFGIHDRALTAQEKKYIAAWFDEFHFDISMVRLAYERTIDNIGKLSFPYTNSILVSWHSKGITNTREASLETMAQRGCETPDGKKDKSTSSSIDMDELEYYLNHGTKPQ